MNDDATHLEFDGELLLSEFNGVAYRKVYALEVWLRRICLAAWMSEFGEGWTDHVIPSLKTKLERQAKRNRKRLYLGAESHDELIWETTHSELIQLLMCQATAVKGLTATDALFLQQKLDEVREIRNLLAHNRALSERTHQILIGLLASLDEAVDTFKKVALYGDMDILVDDDDWVGSWLAILLQDNDWSRFQGFAARRGPFIQYVSLPVDRNGADWPDARLLLDAFRGQLDRIVAFCLNRSGDEYSVLTPLVLEQHAQAAVCSAFAQNPLVWTDVPFDRQHPRFVCSPKIWFYENRSPL